MTDSLPHQANPPALFLMGPTASGKTDLAALIAQRWPVEVISVDSALVYRDMNIGTAKPDAQFLKRLPHFMIDIRDPDQPYSAAEFRQQVIPIMSAIAGRGKIPLLVGGTMMYFKILLEGIADIPTASPEIRQSILDEAELIGWQAMHEKLHKVDPQTASRVHPNHSQRIQRALEVYRLTGSTLSELQSRQPIERLPFRVKQFALWPTDRAQLHARINERFEQMLEQGFIDEVIGLRQKYDLHADLPSMRAVGYRQIWDFLEQTINKDALLATGVAATRQLAKRQLTWLRKWDELQRLELDYSNKSQKYERFGTTIDEIAASLIELGL